jgi:hypothetical protein
MKFTIAAELALMPGFLRFHQRGDIDQSGYFITKFFEPGNSKHSCLSLETNLEGICTYPKLPRLKSPA